MLHRLFRLLAVVGALAFASAEENGLSREQLLLARVRLKMNENLGRQPNYTCLETIERSRRSSAADHYRFVDRVRLEVAYIDGKEMFSWPGARNFENRELRDMVFGGAIGNGNFALHARAVFSSSAPVFDFAGERIYEGRETLRWDFRVKQLQSGYMLRNGEREAVVGYHGSVWADAQTLEPVRIEVYADEIPPELEIAAAADAVNYGRVRLQSGDFLLPVSSELRLTDYAGESRNAITFNACRQYQGESKLSFDEPSAVENAPSGGHAMNLPAGAELPITLSQSIATASAAVGDPIEAVTSAPVKSRGVTLVPKGAAVRGRVMWAREMGQSQPFHVVGLELNELSFGGTTVPLSGARLVDVSGVKQSIDTVPPGYGQSVGLRSGRVHLGDLTNFPGVLFVRTGNILLPKGLRLLWRMDKEKERQ